MLSAIREALKISNLVSVAEPELPPLKFAEAFHLATVAGAEALGWPGVTGNFADGALFDALLIDPDAHGSPLDLYEGEGPLDAFQKWLQLGDDRNTAAVWVGGKQVLPASGRHCQPCR